MTPDGLTVTIAFGASLFDSRYGLAARKPRALKPMTTFPDDALVAEECHGDLLVQLCANSEQTLLNALRDLMRATRGSLAPRWKIEGFLPVSKEPGKPRNLLGFKDGTANPDTADRGLMDRARLGARRRAGVGRRRHLPGGAHHPQPRRVLGPRGAPASRSS